MEFKSQTAPCWRASDCDPDLNYHDPDCGGSRCQEEPDMWELADNARDIQKEQRFE